MTRRSAEKVLQRIARLVYRTDAHLGEGQADAFDAATSLYRWGTVLRALRRRRHRSGGGVCIDCAVRYGLDRC